MTLRLKERREELGLTLEEVGKLAGVGKSTVRKWETGYIQNMGRDKIISYANALRINPMDIIDPNNDIADVTTINKITTISSKLNPERQERVYDFAEQQYNEQNNIIEINRSQEVETWGAVSAGTGEYLETNKDKVSYNGKVPNDYDFAVIVNGNSMEPLFENKQIIFVKKSVEAWAGQIVIANYNGESYVKKFMNDEKGMRLVSLNKNYNDLPVDEDHPLSIFGVVVL